jgi:hypothetical protein
VVGGEPLAVLEIYPSLVLLTRRDQQNWTSYPVSPDALAEALANQPASSGLLPPHTLAAGRIHGRVFAVQYVPPQRATLRMRDADFDIALPPLVFGGCGDDYRIFALNKRGHPTRTDVALYVPPFSNTYRDGRICWGDSDPRPAASPDTLGKVLQLFLTGSLFNLHVADGKSRRYPKSIVALWQELKADQPYPLDDLVRSPHHLEELVSGSLWGAASEANDLDDDDDDDEEYE